MIQATRARHATFVIVEMPMPSAHITKYYNTAEWRAYEAHLLELSNAKGAMFINAGDWLKDEEFADDLHVNEAGRVDFSSRLAEKLKPLPGQ